MTVHDTLTCTVETLAYGGDGIARVDGLVLFIPATVPGETVRARVTLVKKNFARAELTDLLAPSPLRIEPCCRVADPDTGSPARVPGCVYDHLDYAAEIQAKQQQLEGFIRRLPQGADARILPPFASPAPLHYRNKIVLHAQRGQGRTRLGYRQEPSHRVLDISSCPLACEEINVALARLREPDFLAGLRDGADITLRHTAHDGAVWWQAGDPPRSPPDGLFTEASPAGPLRVPRDGFYQVNPAVGDVLARTVSEWFAEDADAPELLDLYCGVGVFGLACMKAGGTRLTGIESGRSAVAAARQNALALNIPGEFRCAALGQEPLDLRGLVSDPHRATALVDPPRDGLAPEIARALADGGLRRVFYVSCDPATLSRDLAVLLSGGYRLRRMRLFDMFPRTAHFETLAELRRED